MSYLRGACGATRWEDESNETVYEKCGMGSCANVMKCGVVEWVKRNTLRWSGHMERIKSEEILKEVYVSELEDSNLRGSHLVDGGIR